MWFFAVILGLGWFVMPVWALVAARRAERETAGLRERVRRLEAERGAALVAVPPPDDARAGAPAPPPIPFPLAGAAAAPPAAAPAAAPPAEDSAARSARPFFDSARAEEMVGGLWMQNAGAVLVMLGAFFSILWGYTSGRLGPAVLVMAGVLFGAALAWRGDRLARTLPPIGHALIGVGLGVAYLSLYLGWFTLHVLPTAAALPLLAFASFGTMTVGLRYRAQAIAALGVIGAFVPQLMSGLLHLRGFDLGPPALLGYLAVVNAVVFALGARAGWSLLALGSLGLTTLAWIPAFPPRTWGWGPECGLAVLYAVVGLAPLARLARTAERARPSELAVIVAAPLLFAVASWPFLEYASRIPAAVLLLALAGVHAAAAWWIDSRRPSDDAWRPLTAGATLFVTIAVERAVGTSYLSLAWLAEGAALVWLGSGRRGAWLRGLGATVSCVGGLVHLFGLLEHGTVELSEIPFVHPHSLRSLAGIALVLVTGALLRREDRFGVEWRKVLSRSWVMAAMVMLIIYSAAEADHLARALEGTGGRWAKPPALGAPALSQRVGMLQAFLSSALWTLQAAGLVAAGWRRRSAYLRWLGLGLLGLTVAKFALADLAEVDVFWRFVSAVLVGVVLLAVSYFYQRRMRRARTG